MKKFNDDDLLDRMCPECGEINYLVFTGCNGNDYRCGNCGYEGNLQDDLDAENYFWDEMLCNCDEDEKGEVFDGD